MDFQTWLAFFAASCLIAVSPGSGAVLSMSHGLSYGVRKASATILGLQLGLLLILVIAGAGVGSLLLASEVAFSVVKVAGACYLIYVGFSQWRAGDNSPLHGDEAAPAGPWTKRCLAGFLTNATNPKGIVFMVAVLPQFIDAHRPLWPQLALLLLTSVAVEMVVMHGYAFLASRAQRWLATAKARRAQNRMFGGVLMAMGASLLMVKRAAG